MNRFSLKTYGYRAVENLPAYAVAALRQLALHGRLSYAMPLKNRTWRLDLPGYLDGSISLLNFVLTFVCLDFLSFLSFYILHRVPKLATPLQISWCKIVNTCGCIVFDCGRTDVRTFLPGLLRHLSGNTGSAVLFSQRGATTGHYRF